ncbi:MAG: hypothetical protein ACOYD3_06290 [Kiritimatiellia bacterium]|jgi:hypothetical protein
MGRQPPVVPVVPAGSAVPAVPGLEDEDEDEDEDENPQGFYPLNCEPLSGLCHWVAQGQRRAFTL